MNFQVRLFFLLLTHIYFFASACSQSRSQIKTIYNSDSRSTVDSISDPKVLAFSGSVALISQKLRISKSVDKNLTFRTNTVGNILGLCSSERFRDDLLLGDCSGFLISDQLLVTAGHCIKNDSDCAEKIFIFGHTEVQRSQFSSNEIYSCSRIVNSVNKDAGDLVLVELDRAVESRPGTHRFKIPNAESPQFSEDSSNLMSLGHPLGTSMKQTPLEKLFPQTEHSFFKAQMDVVQGASGSPLFNPNSGVVHGVLVGGSKDFEWDESNSCAKSHVCDDDSCSGEIFASIASLRNLVNQTTTPLLQLSP